MTAAPKMFHDVDMGAARLLAQARDLPIEASHDLPLDAATQPYSALFQRYVRELEWAVGETTEWWNGLVAVSMENGLSEMDALREQYEQRPAGPASAPEIVYVVRTFWLEIVALNAARPAEAVAPPTVLLAWLRQSGLPDLYEVLSGMPYWPIGLDENDNWC